MTEAELYRLYKGVYLPSGPHPPESLKSYEEFAFRKDDILIATYPKSGTIWMKEIVSLIMSGGDPTPVETIPYWIRVPWLELQKPAEAFHFERPPPRMYATHLQYNAMPPSFFEVKPKVLYVMRNPKDVFTSSFHYHKMTKFLVDPGSQSEFLDKFLDGRVVFGTWFDHVKSWLNAEDKEPIMYLSYEDMKTDLTSSVSRIAQFLEKPLDADAIEKISDRCLFENMKENKMTDSLKKMPNLFDQAKCAFLRKGICGDWKNQLTAEEAEHFDAVYKDKMKDVKYKFVWD